MSRSALLTLFISLALGLALGLYIGWVITPVQYVDTDPASLSQTYKDDYILMIAIIYSENGDLAAAQTHLNVLGFDNPGPAVAAATRRFIAAHQPEADLRRLARLAAALNAAMPEMLPYLPTPATQTPKAP